MNTLFIVLPILTLLMFELGLELNIRDFLLFRHSPRPIVAGLIGQILLLPLLAILLGLLFRLEPVFFIGLVLIACSPGGSSSNVFSMIAKGNVALSVSLTALSSLITLFTIPPIMAWTTRLAQAHTKIIELPVFSLIMQNLIFSLLPIILGIFFKHRFPRKAETLRIYLHKISFPALLLLVTVFFIQHHHTISAHIGTLGICICSLILLAMLTGYLLSRFLRLTGRDRRTILIEIGMQNAAQSIAIASSPFVFNNPAIAIPSIIYALLMNLILLTYIKTRKSLPVPVNSSGR